MKIELNLAGNPKLAEQFQEVADYTGQSTSTLLEHALEAYCSGDGNALRNDLFAASMAKGIKGIADPSVPAFAECLMSRQV
jgi:hypothetical protein